MRSMVDTEGLIEVASQSAERGEYRKVDHRLCVSWQSMVWWWGTSRDQVLWE